MRPVPLLQRPRVHRYVDWAMGSNSRQTFSVKPQHAIALHRLRGGEPASAYLERLIERETAAAGVDLMDRDEAVAALADRAKAKVGPGPKPTIEELEALRTAAFG